MPARVSASVVLFLLLSGVPAFAQQDGDRFELSFFAGHSFLNVDSFRLPAIGGIFTGIFPRLGGGSFEGGFQFGARFGYRMHPRATIEAAYRFTPDNELNRTEIDIPVLEQLGRRRPGEIPIREIDLRPLLRPVSQDVHSHAVTTNLLYHLRTGKVTPFLTAGLGAEIFDLAGGTNRTHFTWNVGGGLQWQFRPGLAARVDARESFISDFFVTRESESSFELQLGLVVGF